MTNAKRGLFIGTIIGTFFVFLFILVPSRGPLLPNYTAPTIIFFILSLCLPIILSGTLSGIAIEGFLIKKILSNKFLVNHKLGSVSGCIIGGLVFFPIGAFLGLIIGGQLGGGLGSAIGEKVGMSKITISTGIASGMILITIGVTLIGSAISAIGGAILNTVIRKMSRRDKGKKGQADTNAPL